MKKLKFAILALCAMGIMGLTSCKDDEQQENARLRFMLTDAPANYDAVNVDIQEIEVRVEKDGDTQWHTLDDINPGIYNLLDFRNGIDTAFADGEVPPGAISEIRLILGPNNSLVINGVQEELKTPSAQQSGLKLKINDQLSPGILYEYWLDFDAERSVVDKGNGTYNLKPVIRVFTQTSTGSIAGFVNPLAADPYVLAYNANGDSAATPPDTTNGYFLIYGLDAGVYEVEFDATAPFIDQNRSAVGVTVGNVTDLDTVSFTQ